MLHIISHWSWFVIRKQPFSVKLSNLRNNLLVTHIKTESLAYQFKSHRYMLSGRECCIRKFIVEQMADNLLSQVSPDVFGKSKEDSAL